MIPWIILGVSGWVLALWLFIMNCRSVAQTRLALDLLNEEQQRNKKVVEFKLPNPFADSRPTCAAPKPQKG